MSRGWRERIAFRLPSALVEFPFEFFIAAFSVLMGAAIVFGATRPGSIVDLLPWFGVDVWGAGLAMGGLTIAFGLARHLVIVTSMGLGLLAFLFPVYAIAVVAVAGVSDGLVAGGFCALLGTLSAFRSFYLRALAEVGRRIYKES